MRVLELLIVYAELCFNCLPFTLSSVFVVGSELVMFMRSEVVLLFRSSILGLVLCVHSVFLLLKCVVSLVRKKLVGFCMPWNGTVLVIVIFLKEIWEGLCYTCLSSSVHLCVNLSGKKNKKKVELSERINWVGSWSHPLIVRELCAKFPPVIWVTTPCSFILPQTSDCIFHCVRPAVATEPGLCLFRKTEKNNWWA